MPENTLPLEDFVKRWANTELKERQSYQAHFIDVCRLIGIDPPDGSGKDANGLRFMFEAGVKQEGGAQGFADVWYEGHFAIEYKAPNKYKSLDDAYNQLKKYREALNNPPLLIVTDIFWWEIHTNFTNAPTRVYRFAHDEIGMLSLNVIQDRQESRALDLLRYIFKDPNRLHPNRSKDDVTQAAAAEFEKIASAMRAHEQSADPDRIAHFLTKLVFCLFAEDVGLLPTMRSGHGMFSEIIEETYKKPTRFMRYMRDLFSAMANGGDVLMREVRYFNGHLFDDITVEELPLEALNILRKAAALDWSNVEPAIFGTLFERSLDPSKRSQLGAHYTSPQDIDLIIQPVLMQPLLRAWEQTETDAALIRQEYDAARNPRERLAAAARLTALRDAMLERLRTLKVLDPACGSGNFLYMSLRALLSLEKRVILAPYWSGQDFTQVFPEVHPRQMYGIEVNPIAHSLATIVVWIGWIQWKLNNGYPNYPEPILQDLGENIRKMDAILALDADGQPVEPAWEPVDVIVGNPPFLGARKLASQFDSDYLSALYKLYNDRVSDSDLVVYWFEKCRRAIEENQVKRVGLISTNSIRGGANRVVLERIIKTGNIFMAWDDRDWVLDGAAVRVSLVGFDNGAETEINLNGKPVSKIHANLTSDIDITKAVPLAQNAKLAAQGTSKTGAFDISYAVAKKMLDANPRNREVVRPWLNGLDIVRRPRNMWIIDFDRRTLEEAQAYTEPYQYILKHVKPERDKVNQKRRREVWWQHGANSSEMRARLSALTAKQTDGHITQQTDAACRVPTNLSDSASSVGTRHAVSAPPATDAPTHTVNSTAPATDDPTHTANPTPHARYIVTPRVAKHRIFIWVDMDVLPDSRIIAIARDDDYFFGVLHSRIHEIWSLKTASWHGVGNDPTYNTESCFETFPFPYVPGAEPTQDAAYQRISAAAAALHTERDAWLHPPHLLKDHPAHTPLPPALERQLKDRTLTNLYNALAVFRGQGKGKTPAAAADFAPRLDALHRTLDEAVCAAYGWEPSILEDESALLGALLARNLG